MNKDEVLVILRGVCDPEKVDPVDTKREWVTLTLDELERFAAAMYAKGAEDMRERAANVVLNVARDQNPTAWAAGFIRALPISDSPNTFTPTNTEGEQG